MRQRAVIMARMSILDQIDRAGLSVFREKSGEFISSYVEDKITHIGIEVHTGGAQGGNCWNDDQPEEFSTFEYAESDKLLEGLDKLGFITLAEMSQTDRNALTRRFDSSSRTEYEYYGNYNTYESVCLPVVIRGGRIIPVVDEEE